MTDQHAESVPTVGSLFSGIGGIDLGLERAGFRVVWQAETDPYASKVLAKHWPNVPNLGDVTKIDWENDGLDHGDGIARSLHVDLVCGGFPCQPVSIAGRRLAQFDSRWLWPELARCVRLLRPGHVLVENVPGLLVRGMGDVLGDLAALGYDCEWTGIPAAAVGAPHLRWRIFVIAHTDNSRAPGGRLRSGAGGDPDVDDTDGRRHRAPQGSLLAGRVGSEFSGWWTAEPDVGRVDHGIPSRVDRLRCLGNAVVPQVAEFVGRQLAAHFDGDVSA